MALVLWITKEQQGYGECMGCMGYHWGKRLDWMMGCGKHEWKIGIVGRIDRFGKGNQN